MRWKKIFGFGCLGLLAFLVIAGTAVWIWKPWVPPIEFADAGPNGQRIKEDGLLGNYYPAEGDGPHPAILRLGGSEGGLTTGSNKLSQTLQKRGYSVLYLSYFRSPEQNEKLEMIPLEYFDKALAWLKKQPNVDSDRVGIWGGSKGAEAALIVASRNPELGAVIAAMPSNVAWQGFDWASVFDPTALSSSWSLNGKPIPFARYGTFDYERGTASIYSDGLKKLAPDSAAFIPIENSPSPIMMVCGELDNLWPACPMARAARERAEKAGKDNVMVLAYDEAGHGVAGQPRSEDDPNFERLGSFGGTPKGNNEARKDNWPKILAFLDEHLKPAKVTED